MRIALGSDHAGFVLKTTLGRVLGEWGHEVEDLGTTSEASTDYPDYAHAAARLVAAGRCAYGVLVCGTGVGMAMSANKHPGIRAVVCSEPFSARMARAHNDANVVCVGQRVVGVGLATDIVRAFVESAFEGGRHVHRVAKIEQL